LGWTCQKKKRERERERENEDSRKKRKRVIERSVEGKNAQQNER